MAMANQSLLDDFDYSDEDVEDQPDDTREVEEIQGWDVMRNPPPESESESYEDNRIYNAVIKTIKVITYAITFSVILGGIVISKLTLTLMTSQLEPDRRILYCSANRFGKGTSFEATIPELEKISWAWAILFAFTAPEIQCFLRSLRICLFKGYTTPKNFFHFLIPIIFEVCHAAGLALFVFSVLPSVDAVKSVMLTNCVCFLPILLTVLAKKPFADKRVKSMIVLFVNLFALIFQISGFLLWPILSTVESPRVWTFPLASILISFGWWENYVDKEEESDFRFMKYLGRVKNSLFRTRYFVYFFISIFKIAAFGGVMLLTIHMEGGNVKNHFQNFSDAFKAHQINFTEIGSSIDISDLPAFGANQILKPVITDEYSVESSVYATFIIQILASYFCYIFGKFACRITIQEFSFAFPVSISVPVTVAVLIGMCGFRDENTCFWGDLFPKYLYWTCPKGNFLHDFIKDEYAWAWILWFLSQTWITLHLWNPKTERLAATERVFCTPMYSSLLMDQSLAFNRRADDGKEVRHIDSDKRNSIVFEPTETEDSSKRTDTFPRIIACATMWHENKEEMMEMLKSIFRMDIDACARRLERQYFGNGDRNYYEFETNIFFDDAFELETAGEANSPKILNSFVKDMVNCMDEAASHVHEAHIRLEPPKKIPTPYGGRIIWTLPGKTQMILHLKDKDKIRHKKRWSQVMYMYYLLGHKIMDQPYTKEKKEVLAENTYLLALDGDIDFQPKAVELLVDLMKKNARLGAACGRIHPIGSGPMVWYQKFEYAIGHWLQKATEHMIGCVLCSPGCFSLFRARALMDDSVAAKYTKVADQPRHYVQYDQGEDRWLCTLILQQGWRVEYSAASDAKTHAPEGFGEFYNQRRRWVPSTMANIFDLLGDYKRTIKRNPNISLPYIAYQFMMMVGTILGPGTIFLMLIGAFVVAFRIDNWTSLIYNAVPILLFIASCFFLTSNHQILLAQLLSAMYALVMIAVLVGIILQIVEDGLLAPSSLFLVAIAASFIIAGIIHPMEFDCLLHGVVYYITIPSMYLLLIIYSLFNLNVVSWGTREVAVKKSKQELDAEAKEAEEAKKKSKKSGGLFGFIPTAMGVDDTEGSIEFSLAGLFKIMCCTTPKPDEKPQLSRIADSLDKVSKRLDKIERGIDGGNSGLRRGSSASVLSGTSKMHELIDRGRKAEPETIHEDNEDEDEAEKEEETTPVDDLMNPYWIEDSCLKRAITDFLTGEEINFWHKFIEKYLKPLDADKAKQKKEEEGLKDLRNKMVFAFFMINLLFVVVVFLLQLNKDQIFIKWPFGAATNVTYEGNTEMSIETSPLQLEPIGLAFVAFFAIILLVQFLGMVFHRFETLTHILASTELNFCSKGISENGEDYDGEHTTVLKLLKVNNKKKSDDFDSRDVTRRKTVQILENNRASSKIVQPLDVHFKKNFNRLSSEQDGGQRESRFRASIKNLQRKRTIHVERRNSVLGAEARRSTMVPAVSIQQHRDSSTDFRDRMSFGQGTINEAYEEEIELQDR